MNDNNKQNYFKQVKKCWLFLLTLNKSKNINYFADFEQVKNSDFEQVKKC